MIIAELNPLIWQSPPQGYLKQEEIVDNFLDWLNKDSVLNKLNIISDKVCLFLGYFSENQRENKLQLGNEKT